jgi:hypothetical protein
MVEAEDGMETAAPVLVVARFGGNCNDWLGGSSSYMKRR